MRRHHDAASFEELECDDVVAVVVAAYELHGGFRLRTLAA